MTSGVIDQTAQAEDAAQPPDRPELAWGQLTSAAGLWVAGRAALIGFVLLDAWLTGLDQVQRQHDWSRWAIDRFMGGDTGHFLRIADVGYPPGTCCDQAFLPGYPLAIRVTSGLTGGDLRLASLLVSLIAGAVAAALLWQLATGDAERAGGHAVLYLMVAPYGIFLTSGYSEAMFLAAALAAWVTARRRHWWLAGAFMALTVSVRINGLFLVAALALMYLLQLRARTGPGRRPHLDIAAFALPVAALAAIAVWLHRSTGSWNAWQETEHRGWGRQLAWPWAGLADGWNQITNQRGGHILIAGVADFATVVLGLVLVVVLAWLRRWPETLYMLLNVAVLVCSTTFLSAPRYALTWFPAFLLAAEITSRRRWTWLHPVIMMGCLPLLAVLSMLYSRQAWVA